MELHNEEWRDVVGYEEFYRVSSYGRLMSKERQIRHVSKNRKESYYTKRPRIIRTHVSRRFGYVEASLYNGSGKEKKVKMHRLVAMAFIPNPLCLPQINHKNEIRHDNRVENLEWCTCGYNLDYNNGRIRRDITRYKRILAYNPDGSFFREFLNASSAANYFGVCPSAIQKNAAYGQKSKTGFTFKYKEGKRNEIKSK